MNSRELILSKIKQNKPEPSPLPDLQVFARPEISLVEHFVEMVSFVGGRTIDLAPNKTIEDEINAIYPDLKNICANFEGLNLPLIDLTQIQDPHDLAHIELAIIKGEFGVAENGAVWIPSSSLAFRALPFITQHMVFVLKKSEIVWNMHQAYQRLDITKADGYGVFISGPSKTADIEQSLVIGAHGSRSLVVILV